MINRILMPLLKVWPILLLVFSLLVINPSKASATIYFSSDWDSGSPASCWPCKSYPCGSTFDNFYESTEPPQTIPDAGRSSTVAHSGTYSFRQFRASGREYGCDIAADIPTHPTTIFVRFYLYLTSNWSGTWTNNASFMHWLFTNTAQSNTGFRLNLVTAHEWDVCPSGQLCMLPEGNGGSQWWASSASPAWPKGINFKDYINKWVCLEYKMQISGSKVILTEYVNGTQTRQATGPGSNTSYFSKIIFSGWENSGASHDADYYIDDIVVADSYIGPAGSDAPAPPSNLQVQ